MKIGKKCRFGRISGISSDRSRVYVEVKIGKNADLDAFQEFCLIGLEYM